MKKISKYYCSGIMVCLAAILIGCGEQVTQSSAADFINYLETGEMKMGGDKGGAASGGGDMCPGRVIGNIASADDASGSGLSYTDSFPFSQTANYGDAYHEALAECNSEVAKIMKSLESLSAKERATCIDDKDGDGVEDCHYQEIPHRANCLVTDCTHEVNNGDNNGNGNEEVTDTTYLDPTADGPGPIGDSDVSDDGTNYVLGGEESWRCNAKSVGKSTIENSCKR